MEKKNKKIAVLIPCYNEEKTIVKVIREFYKVLPEATIYVYDNNSTDKSCYLVKKEERLISLILNHNQLTRRWILIDLTHLSIALSRLIACIWSFI